MPSNKEEMFRLTLDALLQNEDLELPEWLRRDIADHLHRTDAQGLTLCFDSPQREQLIDLIYQWADSYDGQVSERLMYLGLPRRKESFL